MAAATTVETAVKIQEVRQTAPLSLPDIYPKAKPTVGVHPLLKMALLSGFVLMTGLYAHTVFVENQANQKQMRIIEVKEENAKLQASLTELKTLSAVEKKALTLGMQPVEQFHYIEINPQLYAMAEPAATVIAPPQIQRKPVPLGF